MDGGCFWAQCEEEAGHRQGFWGKAVPVTLPWQRKVKTTAKSKVILLRRCGKAVINCS